MRVGLRPVTMFAALSMIASGLLGAQPVPLAAATRPNIVVFYLDDVAPHDGRLWTDPARTPAIYDTFIAHGIHFTHAYGEDPLCCPSRASILSGLHTHNNGVNANDARLYVPQESVANELTDAGYTTMWIGKYMNYNAWLSPQGWAAHMAPWSVFDGIYVAHQSTFYDYTVRTKDSGDVNYGDIHSTQMITDRAVSRFAAAPANKPIFAMLSIYDLHAPNQPMPATPEQLAMCDNFAPWWTPAYNEADVSDKPAYIQALHRLPYADGWPMQTYCREMFGVDTAVKRVTDELAAEGRLDNTLLVFTADNGMSWGAHRRGQQKNTPDATQLPLYMAWPAAWGSAPRVVDDYVSNIDLAPTFCDLGNCTLGPYPSGQSGPDGRSLVPLIGQGTPLGRDAILEQSPTGDAEKHIPGWASIRTTGESGLGLWRYTQYADGERELYDEVNDQYELSNLANTNGYTGLQVALSLRLTQLLNEGRVNRPDVSIWGKKNKKLYAGYNRFAPGPTPAQTLSINAARGTTYALRVDARNNKVATDSLQITANVSGSTDKVVIQWLLDGADVTAQMSADGIQFQSVPGSVTRKLVLKVKVMRSFIKGFSTTFQIHVASTSDSSQDDHLTLVFHR